MTPFAPIIRAIAPSLWERACSRLPIRAAVCTFILLLLSALNSAAQTSDLKPGSQLPELPVGGTTYREVEVRSVNARTAVIIHRGGMASVRLRDLSPEWQQRFAYDPRAEEAADAAQAAQPAIIRPKPSALAKPVSSFETLLQKFGQPAALQAEMDLRPQFFQLELGVKDQGRRPSCAIFAIVSALEFQNAKLTGQPQKFSEEYLSWAVRKTVQRLPVAPGPATEDGASTEDQDEGFALSEVVAALRAYGIPLQSRMPNTFGSKIAAIQDPPADIINEARVHQRVFVHLVPGRDTFTLLNNIVHALNAGLPVAVGMAWPHARTLRNGYLDAQKPVTDSGHAVTLVGYRAAQGRIEEAQFIFKNSWGATWGQGGYGVVTARYLSRHLHSAVLLEVQPAAPLPPS